MKKKTNNILAILTASFIIFASFWCMSLPKDELQGSLSQALAEDRSVELKLDNWDLTDSETGLTITEQNNESLGVSGEQKIYTDKEKGVIGFLNRTVSFTVLTIGSLAILGLVVGGFMMIVGSMKGNEDGVSAGKDAVKYSLIGLALVFLSYFIVSVVQTLLYS